MNMQTPLRVALLMWVGSLFALLGMQRFFIEPLPSLPMTVAVFVGQVAPLLIVLPGALRPGSRGPLWVCLVVLLYFVHGVWQWTSASGRLIGMLEVFFSVGAFVTAWVLLKVMPKDTDQSMIR
jgi:uncharacterized membrane protein